MTDNPVPKRRHDPDMANYVYKGIAEGHLSACEQENRELRAEKERLRAALTHIRRTHEHSDEHPKVGCETCKALQGR